MFCNTIKAGVEVEIPLKTTCQTSHRVLSEVTVLNLACLRSKLTNVQIMWYPLATALIHTTEKKLKNTQFFLTTMVNLSCDDKANKRLKGLNYAPVRYLYLKD